MNPVAAVHLAVAALAVVSAVPLVGGWVRMNCWYGVRVPEAFASERRWLEINRYGGCLLLAWGAVLGAIAVAGAFVPRKHWKAYNWASLIFIAGGLLAAIAAIARYARKTKASSQLPDPTSSPASGPPGRGPRRP